MASINGRLVNSQKGDKIVLGRKAEIEARIAFQRQQAEDTATPIGQTATWNSHGGNRSTTGPMKGPAR